MPNSSDTPHLLPPVVLLVALVAALVLGAGVGTAGASEPAGVVRYFGDTSSATGAALAQGACDVNADGFDDAWENGCSPSAANRSG